MSSNGPLDRLVERCQETGVRRAQDRRWVAGVCIGLAHRWNIDPVLIRVGFILLTIFGGVGITVYLLCWLLLPGPDGSVALDRALRGGDGAAITLLVFAVVVTIGTLTPVGDGPPRGLLGLVILGVVAWWLARSGRLSGRPAGASPGAAATTHGGHGPAAAADAPDVTGGDSATGATSAADAPSRMSQAGATSPAAATDATTPTAPATSANYVAAQHSSHPGAPTAHTPAPVQDVLSSHAAPGAVTWARTQAAPPTTSQPPAPPEDPALVAQRRRRDRTSWLITLLTTGLALLAYLGTRAATAGLGPDRPWLIALSAALGVIGIALVVTAFTGHRVLGLRIAAWIIGINLVISTVTTGVSSDEYDVAWRPTTASEVLPAYEQGAGSARLDLTALPVDGVRDIDVSQGAGELTILVPANVTTLVHAEKGPGPLRVDEAGSSREVGNGFSTIPPFTVGTGPEAYRLDIDGGVGTIDIRVVAPAPAPSSAPEQEVTP